MNPEATSGIERAVFGPRSHGEIDAWLAAHLQARIGGELTQVLFRSGRISAVYGAELRDGRRVTVKVHRSPADPTYLAAAAACQRRLFEAGFPCPALLDGPAATDGVMAVVETLLEHGEPGNGHDPDVRRAIACALHAQLEPLRDFPADDLAVGAPAWSRYANGPWPRPHDPIFDFSTTPHGYTWLDDVARAAADVLTRSGPGDAVAHADWACVNLRFAEGKVSAAYDWDSVAAAPEPVLAGLSGGSFTFGSTEGDHAPDVAEVMAFLRDYEFARGQPFTPLEQAVAAAAATWVLAYNARCEVAFLGPGGPRRGASVLALQAHARHYLGLHWSH